MIQRALLILALTAVGADASSLGAQDADFRFQPPRDSVIQRARDLVVDGKFVDGRRVLDSVIAANPLPAELYPEALYWRGALASTAADAERDYRRLLIETPFAPRAEDAMLQLAQLKNARGDRSGATEHLERYMLLYPTDDSRPSRPRVALWLVRLLFEQNQTSRGCEALRMGRDAMAQESLEMRNQLEFYAPRCAFVEAPKPVDLAPDTAATPPARPMPAARTPQRAPARAAEPPSRPAVDSVTTAAPPRTTAAPRAAAAAPTAKSFFSVQVAAYDSPEAAKRMAEGLVARGLDARVDGTVRPFRVRIGRFATRADAAKLALALKAQGQNGFVTLVNPD